mmetsp:Transcript_33093/g.84531  ORF Transcript_33093/g.84531 Transcript_33093/m.84531 type:complete len:371 (-) Transcript_33093:222-1334(-)
MVALVVGRPPQLQRDHDRRDVVADAARRAAVLGLEGVPLLLPGVERLVHNLLRRVLRRVGRHHGLRDSFVGYRVPHTVRRHHYELVVLGYLDACDVRLAGDADALAHGVSQRPRHHQPRAVRLLQPDAEVSLDLLVGPLRHARARRNDTPELVLVRQAVVRPHHGRGRRAGRAPRQQQRGRVAHRRQPRDALLHQARRAGAAAQEGVAFLLHLILHRLEGHVQYSLLRVAEDALVRLPQAPQVAAAPGAQGGNALRAGPVARQRPADAVGPLDVRVSHRPLPRLERPQLQLRGALLLKMLPHPAGSCLGNFLAVGAVAVEDRRQPHHLPLGVAEHVRGVRVLVDACAADARVRGTRYPLRELLWERHAAV